MNIYHNDKYNGTQVDFETFQKSRFIADAIRANLISPYDLQDPKTMLALAEVWVKNSITPEYYNALVTGKPEYLASSNGYLWDEVFMPMVNNSTAGIMQAVVDVVSGDSVSVSLSCGMHHAGPGMGNGYCTVNSLAIGAMFASREFNRKVTVLDLDAHCGGGTYKYILQERGFRRNNINQVDVSVSPFDTYRPTSKKDYFEVVSSRGHKSQLDKDRNYLNSVEKALSTYITDETDVVFYNAGVDIYPTISPEGVKAREEMVAQALHGKPTVIVMAGGYGTMEEIVPLHMATLNAFARRGSMATCSVSAQ
jgi:acetoin utilization deacetylase AcuC-like enzyme